MARLLGSPAQTALYTVLLGLAVVGNATVALVVGRSVVTKHGGAGCSDAIILNMALSSLLVSSTRNMAVLVSDWGYEMPATKMLCQLLMGVWVWLRSVNVWSTFCLSAFHLLTLRRARPTHGSLRRAVPAALPMSLGLIWLLNFLLSTPAFIFSTNGGVNVTESLILVSSTNRPVLRCVSDFPSVHSGLAFATTSLVIHEMTPVVLMAFTSLSSLHTLYNHGRKHPLERNAVRRVPAELRAAKVRCCVAALGPGCFMPFYLFHQVILSLVMLFVASWGTSVISVTYFNYNRSSSTEFLRVITRFCNVAFLSLSPAVLAFGHRGLRSFIRSVLAR
ncbi:olfactory receptor class A-like protein 4 [Betta splendens]|uniref:Taste receptor type 2 n=1 Tax=Betta splendens TaxID=158456 RepID=A0A8M1HDX1_BETSP|nr:olfactory receptor class A-like protein 4 [Betta splendens]